METLLPKRTANIIYFIALGLILVSCSIPIFLNREITARKIQEKISLNTEKIEIALEKNINNFKKRSDFLFQLFLSRKLEHSQFLNDEALILEENGIVRNYYGQIYYFKFQPFPAGPWKLIKKNQDVFFIYQCEKNIYYVKYFFNIDGNHFKSQLKYPFLEAELKFFDSALPFKDDQFQFDENKGMFFYSHVMRSLNRQLNLNLKFTRSDVEKFYQKKQNYFLFLGVLLFLLVNIVYFYACKSKTNRFFLFAFLFAFFIILYLVAIATTKPDLYMNLSIKTIKSIYEIGLLTGSLLVLVVFLSNMLKRKFQNRILLFFLFNLSVVISIRGSQKILSSVNFLYSDFNFHFEYFTLLLVLFILHIIPLYFVRHFLIKKDAFHILLSITLQFIASLVMIRLLGIHAVSMLVFSLIFFSFLLLKRNFLAKLFLVFLISVSIIHIIHRNALNEKKEFVTRNVVPIFLNQGNYAKFVAREIVHELNRYKDNFPDFFQADWSSKLEEIWRDSIASRENIASGIFAISKEGNIKSFYSYLVPFLKAERYAILPLWAVEDTTAEIYGKKLSLAVASTSVFRSSDFFGRIIVQVLNTPELVLNNQHKVNIFAMNRKINGNDLSYIALNEKNQILDNPLNINLKNITGILDFYDRWINFKFMNLNFIAYVFRQNKNSVIVFFPEPTPVKKISQLFRIFLLFSLILLVTNIKELSNLEWKRIYFSFSIRVFVILILISLLTAIIFSIFSFDFYSQSAEILMRYNFFERGRIAQNIGNNFIEESGDLTPNHLFFLAAILSKDINVYEKGELLFTSNYRKIIQSEVPAYLHSNILQLLYKKNQEFVLVKEEKDFNLFFKVYDYIFHIEFPSTRRDFISEKGQYTDFIIVLFFSLLLIGISFAFFFRNKILSPIRELNRGMEEVEKGNLLQLEKLPSEIDLKSLYLGFNAMVNGIKEQKKNVSEISRMKTLLKMGRRVAHEVKNPLTPIKLSAEQILKSLKDKRPNYETIIQKSVQFIVDEAEHLKRVSYGFLDFSRLDEINPESFNLLNAVSEEIVSFKSLYPKIDFILHSRGENFIVVLDKIKIKQVIKNIIINSIEAIGENRGEIQLQVNDNQERISLAITDNGIGLDPHEREQIFEEDYSTKEIGTGLGLFIVKRIVDLHHGVIEIESRKYQGTRVILDLPKNVSKT